MLRERGYYSIVRFLIVCLMLMPTDCYSNLQDEECKEQTNSSLFYNKTCMAIRTFCSSFGYEDNNTTHCLSLSKNEIVFSDLYNRVLSSEEYFRYSIHCQRCIVSGGSVTNLTPLLSVEKTKIVEDRAYKV